MLWPPSSKVYDPLGFKHVAIAGVIFPLSLRKNVESSVFCQYGGTCAAFAGSEYDNLLCLSVFSVTKVTTASMMPIIQKRVTIFDSGMAAYGTLYELHGAVTGFLEVVVQGSILKMRRPPPVRLKYATCKDHRKVLDVEQHAQYGQQQFLVDQDCEYGDYAAEGEAAGVAHEHLCRI